jgi:hypothetical protein
MTIKKDFLDFKQVINVMLKSGFLLSDNKVKNIRNSKFFDVYYMLMSVKELIRNLQEVKNSNNGKIYLHIENRYLRSFSSLLLNELTFAKDRISVISLARNIQKSSDNVDLLLVIGEVNEKFFLEATRSNLYLIHVINDSFRQPITGLYNMSNNISDITKLVFIFALIDQVFVDSVELINKTNA